MLVAAPESSCGAAVFGGAGIVLETVVDLRFVAVSAAADRSVRPTLVSVALANSGRATLGYVRGLRPDPTCPVRRAGGRIRLLRVSSRELAKWEPMPVAFSAAEAIH